MLVIIAVVLFLLLLFAAGAGGYALGMIAGYDYWLNEQQLEKEKIFIMYVVQDTHPDVNFTIAVGDVTDAEGNVITDAHLDISVDSSDADVVSVKFGDTPNAVSLHFGKPGVAMVSAQVKSGGTLLGVADANFTVTAGDPASISSVALNVEGLTEA